MSEPAFSVIGLSPVEEALYRAMLQRPASSEHELILDTGLEPPDLRTAITTLEARGLLSRTVDSPPRLIATPPDIGIELLCVEREHELSQQQEALVRARTVMRSLAAVSRNVARPDSPWHLIELVRGREAMIARTEQMQRDAQQEVMIFDTPPYLGAAPLDNDIEFERLAAGVRYRTLYAQASLELGGLPKIEGYIERGEDARVAEQLPLKLLVADNRIGLIPLGEQPGYDAMLILHPSPLLSACVALFEVVWSTATPLRLGRSQQRTSATSDLDRRIIALLATGMTDETIGRHLDISRSTVVRHISRILTQLDACSRFQAGVLAAQRGWL